jgi:translation elongation factor 2 (EF-2/EF-G)
VENLQKNLFLKNEKEKANKLHNELIELIAENDEGLMNLYFDKGELDEDEMKLGLRKSMVNHQVFPIFLRICTA